MASGLKVIQSLEEDIVVVLIWMGWGCIVCPSVLFDTFDKKITVIVISTQNFSMFMLLLTY